MSVLADLRARFSRERVKLQLDDIQALIHPVLAHRLLLTNEARLSGVTADGVLDQIAAQLPVPPAAGDEFHGA